MRYCSRCGNALSVGASFCHCCGAELKNLVPEVEEAPVAAPVSEVVAEPVVEVAAPIVEEATPATEVVAEPAAQEPAAAEIVPVDAPRHNTQELKEEKEFLDITHRLLRWERKAWSISGKFNLIFGIVFAAYCTLIGLSMSISSLASDEAVPSVVGLVLILVYGVVFGGLIISMGIVSLKIVGKIPQYTDTLYKDFSATYKRCSSVGMIVLCAIVNMIPMAFYLINFARMKNCQGIIDRILTRQGVK